MRAEFLRVSAIMLGLIAIGMFIMDASWKRVQAQNDAFAKDCNDRGGEVKLDINMRQCLGAKIPSKQTASK